MARPHTCEALAADFRNLGVRSGDLLFIHSSYKSLGPVKDGADTIIRALEDAVGRQGLILMPSFNLIDEEMRTKVWNVQTTPSTVGWLTEFFRRKPGTYRSDHSSHSVAARGKCAAEFVTGHLMCEGLKSPWDREGWGRTFGTHSPMFRAYQANGKILMLGVDYVSSTYEHFVEVMQWNEQLMQDPKAPYPRFDRPALGSFWDRQDRLNRDSVGDADCRLFEIKDYVDTLFHEVENNPLPYL